MKSLLQCCPNRPSFEVTYITGDSHLVCENCMKLEHWSRHIKDNKLLEFSDDKKLRIEQTERKQGGEDVR